MRNGRGYGGLDAFVRGILFGSLPGGLVLPARKGEAGEVLQCFEDDAFPSHPPGPGFLPLPLPPQLRGEEATCKLGDSIVDAVASPALVANPLRWSLRLPFLPRTTTSLRSSSGSVLIPLLLFFNPGLGPLAKVPLPPYAARPRPPFGVHRPYPQTQEDDLPGNEGIHGI
jgi:hypothetical protein